MLTLLTGICLSIALLSAYGRVFWPYELLPIPSWLATLTISVLGILQNYFLAFLLFHLPIFTSKKQVFLLCFGILAGLIFIFSGFHIIAAAINQNTFYGTSINENIFREFLHPYFSMLNIVLLGILFIQIKGKDSSVKAISLKFPYTLYGAVVSIVVGFLSFYFSVFGKGREALLYLGTQSIPFVYLPNNLLTIIFVFFIPSLILWAQAYKNRSSKTFYFYIISASIASIF